MNPRKICVVTGSRAEYGLLRWLMEDIRNMPGLELQIVATAMHLSPEFGLTYRAIEDDGFTIARKVEMLLSGDTPTAIAKSMGLGLMGFAEALEQLLPDIVFLLGDRFEVLAAAAAALVARIPVAHAHGGELTEGAFDESVRHAVTKMAQLHFVAAEEYRRRVIQLGERPENVHRVGGLGVDNIVRLPLLDRAALEDALQFRLGPRNLLITYHPATLDPEGSQEELRELLAALAELEDTHLLFTLPNADTGSRVLAELVNSFVAGHRHARAYTSLGQQRYLSCLRHVDGVVGNSSSGLIEAPAFRIGTVNIGARQQGRLRAASVIDCAPERGAIAQALRQLYAPKFRARLTGVVNPYGDGGASARIVDVLSRVSLDGLVRKRFFDIPVAAALLSGQQ